jgi:alpha-L-fucosidase
MKIRASSFLSVVVAVQMFTPGATVFAAAPATNDTFALPAQDSPEAAWWRESMKTHDERLAWWREARFGMFVHWGVYSSLGNEYKGRKGGGYAEHIQRVLQIPIAEYRTEVAGHFNPTNFNADEWVRTAKEAGMGYIVITAKHHDGFAMWPTKVNDYNVMEATPWHHDPMADLRAACKKYGVKFGFYYSHAFDWGNSNAPGNDWDCNNPGGNNRIGGENWWETRPEFMASARKYVDTKSIPQLQELIKLYDPDIFWFDTPNKLPPSENYRVMKAVRAASARVVINGRLVRRWGDYDSTADRPAEFTEHDDDWEGVPTTNESYGWNKFDDSHKPAAHFIRLLAKAVARGGNTLMNVGPMGDGRLDPKDVAILQGIGAWWRVNGEAIRGCGRTPLPVQTWGESTRKGSTLYLHIFNWPTNGQLVVGGLKANVTGAELLGTDANGIASRSPLKISRLNPLDLSVAVPSAAPNQIDSVIALQCDGAIQTDTNRLLQPGYFSETLRAFDGKLHGQGLKFGPGKKTDDYALEWRKTSQFVTWPVRLDGPATYEVAVNYTAPATSAGGEFAVNLGSQILNGQVKSGTNQIVSLGRVSLPPGNFEIKVAAAKISGDEFVRLRSLELKPVRQ